MKLRLITIAVLVLLFSGVTIYGLAQENLCPALVEEALAAIGDNCGDLGRNQACYGYNQVSATFAQDVPEGYFTQPADRADLTYLQTIQTAPLDIEQNTWGIALMNVQANVPNTLPGQAVVFMLLGDVRVENAVAPDEAFIPADPVATTVTVSSANVRSLAGSNAFVLGTLPFGSEVLADAQTPDGQWFRIIFDDAPAWISREVIDMSIEGLADLPYLSGAEFTPMQAFYFSTGTGQPVCNEAPDSVVVQGPNNMSVTINANGADITISSTVVLRTSPTNPEAIQVMTVSGEAEVDGIVLPAGFAIEAEPDENGTIQPQSWTGFRELSDEELEELQPLEQMENAPLHYVPRLPTREEIQQRAATINANTIGQNPNVHVEIQGETSTSQVEAVDCSNFRPQASAVFPNAGRMGFNWTPARGATGYVLAIFRPNGALATTVHTQNITASVDLSPFINNAVNRFAWNVTALYQGEPACRTGRVMVTRNVTPDPTPTEAMDSSVADGNNPTPTPLPPLNARRSCTNNGNSIRLAWNNLPPGESLRFVGQVGSPGNFTHFNRGPYSGIMGSDVIDLPPGATGIRNVSAQSTDGQVVPLSDIICR